MNTDREQAGAGRPKGPEPSPTATIFSIQRASTEDGPGIRTTVFFKGCNLHCTWCHNPESISPLPQLHWDADRCIGCHACLAVCPRSALILAGEDIVIDFGLCDSCGACETVCPGGALEVLGRIWDVDALVAQLVRDRAYGQRSGGGVTLSGGETGMQPEFAAALLERLATLKIHTALDTNGCMPRATWRQLVGLSDMVIVDLKEMDPSRHQQLTGQDNQQVTDNLRDLAHWLPSLSGSKGLWVRTPVIPGATDRKENIQAIGRFMGSYLDGLVQRWELCAFNPLCVHKYEWLGQRWDYAGVGVLDRKVMDDLLAVARRSGVDPQIVHQTGAVKEK